MFTTDECDINTYDLDDIYGLGKLIGTQTFDCMSEFRTKNVLREYQNVTGKYDNPEIKGFIIIFDDSVKADILTDRVFLKNQTFKISEIFRNETVLSFVMLFLSEDKEVFDSE